ncbi:MAG: hypothetical protein ACRC0G_15915 [Fusobacteriaceae bacterium]
MNHSFNVELASLYGIEEAILIENIAFWIKKNKANNKNYHDGRYWTYNSASAFEELFPYMRALTINRKLIKLEKMGVIKIGNFNKIKMDKTKWFTIINEEINHHYKIENREETLKKTSENTIYHFDKSIHQNDKCIRHFDETIPDINTDINTKHVTCYEKSEKPKTNETIKSEVSLNPKGYPQKDKWEKYLNENLVGIDYTQDIETAIKKLEVNMNEKQIKETLSSTYENGKATGRTLGEIARIIERGNALRSQEKVEIKPKVEEEEEPKMNPKFDTRGTEYIDITDPKVKDEYFSKERKNYISPEDEKRALEILANRGDNLIRGLKAISGIAYINTLKQTLKENLEGEEIIKRVI